jgi:hypothetical protein
MSIFTSIVNAWNWFKTKFVSHIESAAVVAVTITETIKSLLNNPVASLLENIADAVTHSQLPTEIAATVNSVIPKILAVELAIEGLPANPTPAQVLAFEQSILSAFNVNSNNSRIYTELAAQVYGIIQSNIANGTTNFASWVTAVETAFQDYTKDVAGNTAAADIGVVNDPVGTVLNNGNEVLSPNA